MKCEITFFHKPPAAIATRPITETYENVISLVSNEFGWVEMITFENGYENRHTFDWVLNYKTQVRDDRDIQ